MPDSSTYSRDHPWGDNTGTARLSGTMRWRDDGSSPPLVYRRAVTLKGLNDTPSAGLEYRGRTNEQGEFIFDRIQGGEFELSDDTDVIPPHWRLRVDIRDGEARTVDLTPENSLANRPEAPQTRNSSTPEKGTPMEEGAVKNPNR